LIKALQSEAPVWLVDALQAEAALFVHDGFS
jgi:hypothetical protein